MTKPSSSSVSENLVRSICLAVLLGLLFSGCQKPIERKQMFAMEENATISRDGVLYDIESNETINGYVKDLSDDGVRILYQVKNGKRNGEFLGWYPNGLQQIQGSFLNGKEHGAWTTWDENGSKTWEGHRKNGKLHGNVTRWFHSGFKKTEGFYENGLKSGEEIVWHRNGHVWQRRTYGKGKKEGRWTFFDNTGRLIMEEIYRDDQLIDSKKLPDFWLQPGVRAPAPADSPPPASPTE
ncbi:MAG: toxin-antitoxin system YwqK family antitoxin [Opitutales bacterium]|jgi:antitoxin component YwqK of YwqJK toxin-antitoxin module